MSLLSAGSISLDSTFNLSLFKNILICLQVFGACGSRKCEGPSCWQMAGRKYKFYLSLENSICKVTPEPEFVNVEGALESILPAYVAWRVVK